MRKGVVIVELGAGTGVFTRNLLERLPSDGRLIVFEINHVLAEYLRRTINDPRVLIIEDDAVKLPELLNEKIGSKADYVVSGLPLGDFGYVKRQELLLAIKESLSDRGQYIQFQYFLASLMHIKKLFKVKIIGYEIRNVPPAFLYSCIKKTNNKVYS
jgi:phospholipid N-methyltransferase